MMGHEPSRILPNLPVSAYQTYDITTPHDRLVQAVCEQVGCEQWQHGWQSTVDESTPLGKQQADYIRQKSGRTFREQRTGTGLTVFRFEAKQRCFANHQTRPALFVVRDGDWRGNPTGRRRVHQTGAAWVEDFGEHQQRIADQMERG